MGRTSEGKMSKRRKRSRGVPRSIDAYTAPRGVGEFLDCDYFDTLDENATWNGMPIKEALTRFYQNEYKGYHARDGKDHTAPKDIKRKQNNAKKMTRDIQGMIRSVKSPNQLTEVPYEHTRTAPDGSPLPTPVFSKTFSKNLDMLRAAAVIYASDSDAYAATEDDMISYLDLKYAGELTAEGLAFHRMRYISNEDEHKKDKK